MRLCWRVDGLLFQADLRELDLEERLIKEDFREGALRAELPRRLLIPEREDIRSIVFFMLLFEPRLRSTLLIRPFALLTIFLLRLLLRALVLAAIL
jgi:hypothetical protein